jgi:hypothetical protein
MTAYTLGNVPLGSRRAADLLVEKGFDWAMIANLWDTEIPAYTQSLDASIPGENIVATLRMEGEAVWAAVQRMPDGGDIIGRGATEVLARRGAALKGFVPAESTPAAIADRVARDVGGKHAPAPPAAKQGQGAGRDAACPPAGHDAALLEESEWKIGF